MSPLERSAGEQPLGPAAERISARNKGAQRPRAENLGGDVGAADCSQVDRTYAAEGSAAKERAPQARKEPAAQRTSSTARRAAGEREGAALVGRPEVGHLVQLAQLIRPHCVQASPAMAGLCTLGAGSPCVPARC
ncbi:MAG: hypothetical protein ACRCTR_08950 [Actinomycetota bacterium]